MLNKHFHNNWNIYIFVFFCNTYFNYILILIKYKIIKLKKQISKVLY